jgi:NAD(P)-dependent dehydrogenase (short-subunit alcohol dehydrogenase family)
MSDLSGRTTIVVGASRGLGRGIATALAAAIAPGYRLSGAGLQGAALTEPVSPGGFF